MITGHMLLHFNSCINKFKRELLYLSSANKEAFECTTVYKLCIHIEECERPGLKKYVR